MRGELEEAILSGKFGTRNRAELLMRMRSVKQSIKDILWMARRYADHRHTYAPEMFNDAYDVLRTQFGDDLDEKYAHDQGKVYYDIHMKESDVHPYAVDPDAMQQDIPHKKYYGK